MKIWDDITTAALMGTERRTRKSVDAVDPLSTALAGVDSADADGALLASAAIAVTYRRAGVRARKSTVDLPDPAALDALPECSAKAANLLLIVFTGGEYRTIAAEALDLVARAGKRVPPVLLPDVLDFGRGNKDLRTRIIGVLGRRGTWLAAQNPDWSYAAADSEATFDEAAWSIAPREARAAALAEIGRRDPAQARRLLESTWSKENADDRAALLATRINGLSMDDEPFLEDALDDRSAGVREVAGDLLGRLPESRFVQRMITRMRSIVSYRFKIIGGHIFEIKLPDELDKSAERDGMRTPSAITPGEGAKAVWLRHLVESIPPSQWVSEFDLKPERIVALMEKSDWVDALLQGLSTAVARNPDPQWTLALLQSASKRPVTKSFITDLAPAVRALPPATLEGLILDRLDQTPFGAPNITQGLLNLYPGEWPERLARPVIAKIGKTLADYSDHQTISAVLTFLSNMTMKIPPSMANDLESIIPEATSSPVNYWRRSIDQAVGILRFRHDLREAIMEN